MFKNILLATDGSSCAKRAAAKAAEIAATFDARLTLVNVTSAAMMLEDVEASPQARRLSRKAKDEIRRIHQMIPSSSSDIDINAYIPALPSITQALGETIVDEAARIATRHKVKPRRITRVVVEGDAATQVLKQANKVKADLIVMGTRGLGHISGMLIGGVSNKVLHNAKCPTLLVK